MRLPLPVDVRPRGVVEGGEVDMTVAEEVRLQEVDAG
jgi:hypothetical protein